MRRRRPRTPTSAEVKRIARDLQSFLIRDAAAGKRHSRRRLKSIDQISAPVCRFAVERLRQRARRAERVIAKTVWRDLERNLSDRLVFAIGPTSRVYQRAMQALAGDSPRRSWIDINPLDIFAAFPGSLETTARLISVWTEAQAELLARLVRDRDKISSTFFGKRRASRAIYVRAGLSDPHDGGRTVTLVQFADGNRIIYKPRTCDGELLWFEALRWLNRNRLRLSFQSPRILQRKNYGWVEFLPQKACKNLREVRLFYFRWGAQAALAQILGATDLHRGNWLAVGAQPILLDAESIGEDENDPRSEGAAQDRHLPAILRTGLLPIIVRDRIGFYRGIAPFDEANLKAGPVKCWPRYQGSPQKPSRCVDELVAGFKVVSALFSSRRIQKDFFREIILRMPKSIRLLPRATEHYARLVRESLEVSKMVSPGQRWRYLLGECQAAAVNRSIGRAEARALLRCDIPKFTARQSAAFLSRKSFLARVAELRRSLPLLRRRVLSEPRDCSH
jgi:lantibiotic modifying enzyme